MTSLNLSIINIRINKETADATQQTYINKHPDFQREYEAWDDKLKTRFVETMLLGRAMNPIWTILNPHDGSEEILDGMHRITTACDFLNNKFQIIGKYLTNDDYAYYDKKTFSELSADDKSKIRNYNFVFNHLDSSYHTDSKKKRDMYEILNRSSKTLNEYEFNKVLYNPFFHIISEYKDTYNNFFNKSDKRGEIEMEIISFIVLSSELPKSWSSINTLVDTYLKKNIGETKENVNIFLRKNTQKLRYKLEFIPKIIGRLYHEMIISKDKKIFNKHYIPYKFIICRLCFKLKNISVFNRHIGNLVKSLGQNIIEKDIQEVLNCKSRNAMFQKKLIDLIDNIIDKEYNRFSSKNKRCFDKKMISTKLLEQENKCNNCNKNLLDSNVNYEGDHIVAWSKGGKTEYENLQVLCNFCHKNKSKY